MLQKITKSLSIPLTLLVTLTIFTACSDDNGPGPSQDMNILETVQTNSDLSTLDNLLSDYNLADTLSSDEPMIIFAPTNAAFSDKNLDEMTDDEIVQLLKYHIAQTNLSYEDLQNTTSIMTLSGDSLYFNADSSDPEDVSVNEGQAILSSDGTEATNGTIFAVDSLLTPVKE